MTSSSSTIIRIPRTDTDQEDDFILGEVTHSGGSFARGSKPLNLKIVATEGEEPYALTLKHGQIDDLRASSSACAPTEWESILSSLFITASPVEGIEAGAEVATRGKKKSITITIRRRVAGINQRLGALTLAHSPSSEIQLFDWCSQLAISRQTALTSLSTSAAQVADLEARVADLKKQLEELTQSKIEQETELLQKLRALLNEKKAKIRQQQQALSSRARPRSGSQERLSGLIESARSKSRVNVPESQLDEDENEEDGEEPGGAKIGRIGGGRGTGSATARTNTRTARVSRPGKRKPANDVPSSDDDDDDDAKFEKMDVDEPESEPELSSKTTTMGQSSSSKTLDHEEVTDNDEDEDEVLNKTSDRNTPDRDNDETASEPDEGDETVEAGEKDLDVPPPSPPPARRQRTAAASSTTTTPQKKTTAAAAGKGKGEETPTPVSHTKRAGATATRASQSAAVAAVDEGSETESGDEL